MFGLIIFIETIRYYETLRQFREYWPLLYFALVLLVVGSLAHVVGPGPGVGVLLPVRLDQLLLLTKIEPSILKKFCSFFSFLILLNLTSKSLVLTQLMSWPKRHFLAAWRDIIVKSKDSVMTNLTTSWPTHPINQTYESTDEDDGAAKDDEEGLDAHVVLQWLHVSALRFNSAFGFYWKCTIEFVYLHPLVVQQPPTFALEVGVVDGPHHLWEKHLVPQKKIDWLSAWPSLVLMWEYFCSQQNCICWSALHHIS